MLFAVTLLAGFSTILARSSHTSSLPVMLPQCLCSDLSNCIQQETQQLTTCSLSPTCVAMLSNNNQSAITSCLTTRFNRLRTEDTCLQNAIGLGNMGCTNSSSAPQLPTRPQDNSDDYASYDYSDTDTSPLGQYSTCVQACMNSSSNSNNGRRKRDADSSSCPSQLNCALDMKAIRNAGKAMWTAMQTCDSQDQNIDPNVSDCQCLADAGVTIDCQPQVFVVVIGGRSRRAAYEKMLKP